MHPPVRVHTPLQETLHPPRRNPPCQPHVSTLGWVTLYNRESTFHEDFPRGKSSNTDASDETFHHSNIPAPIQQGPSLREWSRGIALVLWRKP